MSNDILELGAKRSRELGLYIKVGGNCVPSLHYYSCESVDRLLGEGVEVSTYDNPTIVPLWAEGVASINHGQALLIGIRPIKKQTLEERALELLREITKDVLEVNVQDDNRKGMPSFFKVALLERAKQLLSERES